ncbi:polyprenyl diphosphate synthase [Oceanicoccus sagamiensis]|uniref:Ditrans,polycis-undecaprenyl-diphosphate synthase ((2E,6E)-farnesyl-diphosphate specific) n=1 Tax=Oceanicoccus sagamiensis TaxID=716816 RepID=A0A1X9NAA8_9GAMM|nr:polyprenyl diphosphate synthase [Oceanicoccus sagamiensis]ARN74990.1 di-trans,poly-cis-decaprenylcistransferase [Oceanicoccus sagamiensis]
MSEPSGPHTFAAVPQHLAIIMDGNSRWAKSQGKSTPMGHKAGVEAVRSVLGLAKDYGIEIVTLFAFSSENWQRPSMEVKALMTLFSTYLKGEIKQLNNDGVRVRFIGDRQRFSDGLVKQMEYAEQLTADNSDTTLVIAVDYGGQWDIANAARQLAEQVKAGSLEPEQIDENLLDQYISLSDLPKPDMCIRTAGEQRVSNFLLWQMAYSEYFFTDTLWPDFGEADMQAALSSYNQRDRRYGGRESEEETSIKGVV